MGLEDDIRDAFAAASLQSVVAAGKDGSPIVVLAAPEGAANAPDLFVMCTQDRTKILFYGRCPLEIGRDRYWDALAYVNAAVTETTFARMYLEDDFLRFRGSLAVQDGRPPRNVAMMAVLFMMEAGTLSAAATYIVDSLMKPDEAVRQAMTMLRQQARDALT